VEEHETFDPIGKGFLSSVTHPASGDDGAHLIEQFGRVRQVGRTWLPIFLGGLGCHVEKHLVN
jgi:hypothetical protein